MKQGRLAADFRGSDGVRYTLLHLPALAAPITRRILSTPLLRLVSLRTCPRERAGSRPSTPVRPCSLSLC